MNVQMFDLGVLGIGLGGTVGGIYILYLAYFKPATFPKPERAKREGLIAFIVGLTFVIFYFFRPWQ